MADDGILGLLGKLNDPNALYQGALSDPATQQAMAGRGLLAMAGSFADSAMPTRMPTPFGAVLGHAAGALGTSEDAVIDARLKAAQAQLAGSTVGLQNILGPAYLAQIEAARRALERGGGGIPSPPAPGAAIPGTTGAGPVGPAPTGPIDPALVTWHAKNLGLDPLIAHTTLDIESGYGANTGNEKSPSNTGAYQRARADAPGGQNDTIPNQISLGIGDLVGAKSRLGKLLGREPTNAEVYLAHQQGPDGAYKLISNLDTPAGNLVRPINISNNAGDPKASAGAFVKHWEQEYNKREARFAGLSNVAAAGPPGGGIAAGPPPPPGAAVDGLLKLPDFTGQMNAPIPGIAAPTAAAPGTPAAAAAAGPPRSAGDILVAANQATQAAGGLPRLSPGLPQMADASGQVPPGPILVPGGKAAIPGLLPPSGTGPPPQIAAGPPPLIPQPPPDAPVPPAARPQLPAPPPVAAPPAPPMGGPPAPPPLNLPAPPPMPGGAMGPPVQPTPEQMIAQGIVGISALIGKPAPEYMQKLAGQPLEMQMEAYKAYVAAQANQMTEKYKKEIEVASAGTLEWLRTQAGIPAQKELQTHEQDLHLRNEMAKMGFLMGPSGKYDQINPVWLDMKAREAAVQEQAKADNTLTTVVVTDANGQHEQQMTVGQARDYYRTQGGGPGAPGAGAGPGTPGAGIPGLGIPGGAGAPGGTTAPGMPGKPIYNPMQTEGMGAVAKQNAIAFEKVHTDAAAANEAQAQATNMREGAKTFYTGPLSAYNQALNKVLTTLSGDPERASKVAGYEAFIKDTGFLARQQASAMGSKVGIQELTMVKDSLASEETSPRGLDRVMAQVQGLSDYKLVKQQAMNNYVNRPGAQPGGWDNNGFEAQFNANLSPYTFMYMRLSDIDKAELKANLFKTKEGRADLQRLNGQIDYVTKNNLMPR